MCAAAVVMLFMMGPARAGYAQTLPAGWASSDIGSPAAKGHVSTQDSAITVSAGGTDIWDGHDQFRFVYRKWTGDGVIVARVASLQRADAWSKAGVMIRESLSANAKHGFVLVSGTKGIAFQRRRAAASTSVSSALATGTAPQWLRLERKGATLTASRSSNGTSWTTIGTDTIAMGSAVYVGLAVTAHHGSARATAVFSNVTVDEGGPAAPGPLPAGWSTSDIGNPSNAGAAASGAGVFTISGTGSDVWGTGDQFRFVYRKLTGDGAIIARVQSLKQADDWSKAGLMMRESLSAGARHGFVLVSGARGLAFQHRDRAAAASHSSALAKGVAPVWLRLERRGSTLMASRSTNGTAWTAIGSATIAMPAAIYVGLAVTSHDASHAATAAFGNVSVTGGSSSVPANAPPAISLTGPAQGAAFSAPATIALSAAASDGDGYVTRVDFYRDGVLLGSDTSSPYAFSWAGVAAGSYVFTAVAHDDDGASAASAPRTITVTGANRPPSVALTSPVSGAAVTAPASFTISATASDPDGTIARVDFYRGSVLIGSDTSSPYSVRASKLPEGTYSIVAMARDNDGAVTTSGARTVVVKAAPLPKRAVFVPSTNHGSAVTSYRLDIYTNGSNPASANPVASKSLGKPPVVNGECSVDVSAAIAGLPGGTYVATVTAIGPGGSVQSAASAPFAR